MKIFTQQKYTCMQVYNKCMLICCTKKKNTELNAHYEKKITPHIFIVHFAHCIA